VVRFFRRVVGKLVEAFQVKDLGVSNRFLLNFLDEALQDPDPHPELLNAKGGNQASQKIHVDLNILKPLRTLLGVLPELIEVLFEVIEFRLEGRVVRPRLFSSRHAGSSLSKKY